MPKISPEGSNRVWIEIENHANEKVNEERAKLATNLIQRLGSKSTIDYHEGFYILRRDDGEFTKLQDNGHWFNLEFFGRPI